MSNAIRIHWRKIAAVMLAVSTGLFWILLINSSRGAEVSSRSVTLTNAGTSATSNHTISFTVQNDVSSSSTITLTYPAEFTLSGTLSCSDVDVAVPGLEFDLNPASNGCTQTASAWGVSFAPAQGRLTLTAPSATSGVLDISWGTDGTVTYNSGSSQDDRAYGIAIDSDRNIYVAGYQQTNGKDWAVRKYDANGNLDTSWGSGGMVTYNSGASQNDYTRAIAIDFDRNIYVAGYQQTNGNDWAIRKYDASGVTSTAWGTDGMVTYNSGSTQSDIAYAIAIDADRNIYVAGSQQTNGNDWAIRKYDANGNLNTSWGLNGMVIYNSAGSQNDNASAIEIDSDRNIYVAGYQQTNGYDWAIRKWMDQLRWQRLPSFQQLAEMLLKHLDGILNYCRTKVRFGVVEAINGNIRMLINRGRGYKNMRYLLLKAQRMAVTNTEYLAFPRIRKAA